MPRLIILILVVLLLAPINATAETQTAAPDIYGIWLVGSKRAAVEIQDCNGTLCGKVVWIIDGGLTIDKHNPDKTLRTRPICGLKLLHGFTPDGNGEWSGGKIYDAKKGKTYSSTIRILDKDTLFLRGYIGMPLFGKTQKWTRLSGDHARCTPPESK